MEKVDDDENFRKAIELLQGLEKDSLPEFCDRPLTDIHQVGVFGNTPLHIFVVRNDIEAVKTLLRAGADANAKGELEDTPLHDAASFGSPDLVRLLLENGADTDAKNRFGESPLDLALMRDSDKVIELLRK